MADATSSTPTTPWFAVAPGGEGTGQSITAQRTALNEQVNGVADDMSGTTSDLTTALNGITTAINNLPSA